MLEDSPTRVLVVDDDPMIVATLQEIFGQAGLLHAGAASGSEALKKLATEHFDAVVIDAVMPDLSGPEVLRQLRKTSSDSPAVIYFTAFPDISAYDTFLGGADAVLIKPRPSEELVDTVQYLATKRRTQISQTQNAEIRRQQLEDATCRAAIETVISGLCHDLKNPLAAAGYFAQGLRKELSQLGDVSTLLTKLERLETCLERINSQIDDMSQLSFVKPEPAVRSGAATKPIDRRTNVKSSINDTLIYVRPTASLHMIRLLIPELPDNLWVALPPTALQLILKQLFMNACAAVSSCQERWLKVVASQAATQVVIKITDSGLGIPVNERQLIMEPFFSRVMQTASSDSANLGLGLAISRRTADRFGGTLELGPPSGPTEYILTLPCG